MLYTIIQNMADIIIPPYGLTKGRENPPCGLTSVGGSVKIKGCWDSGYIIYPVSQQPLILTHPHWLNHRGVFLPFG